MNNLDFAIQMELDGQKYYLEQADIYQGSELSTVFRILADAEQEHAALLIKRKNQEPVKLEEKNSLPEIKSIFRGLPHFKAGDDRAAKQRDAYRFAEEQEEKSIELYQRMLAEALEEKDKELFGFLVKQEQEHLILFENLVILLLRPEEWVESAEFGIREEY
jgi:rubrerythrin